MWGWGRTWQKHLLYDLEERSVKLGEDLIAVFKLKTNIVGFYPRDVLKYEEQNISGQEDLESYHDQKSILRSKYCKISPHFFYPSIIFGPRSVNPGMWARFNFSKMRITRVKGASTCL